MKNAPIILFVYNRLDHTIETIESLQKNYLAEDSQLFIFSDGPKNIDDVDKVNSVRNFIKSVSGFKSLSIIEQENNIGLAQSIINGVTEVVNEFGKVIVLEDDIVSSKYFLTYMNDALNIYENDELVMHVSGYFFPVANKNNLPETFFYQQTSCWGWGTWKRAWKYFNPDAEFLLNQIKEQNMEHKFNIDGSSESFTDQLVRNANGTMKTWAIKWQASVFLKGGLSLHPNKSLTKNIGNDGSGTNVGTTKSFNVKLASQYKSISRIEITESKEARQYMKNFYNKIKKSHRSVIKKYLKKITKYTLLTLKNPKKIIKNFYLLKVSLLPRFTYGKTRLLGKSIIFPDSASFLFMNEEIFNKEIYNFKCNSKSPYIIDGGANIGLATIYIKNLYPEAEIVAFEPDPEIFKIINKNLQSFGFNDVKTIEKGLWKNDGSVSFLSDGSDGGHITDKVNSETKIEVVRLKDYLNRKVDLLKLDIEGSEIEVIEDCKEVLKNVDNVFVEYHSFTNKKQELNRLLEIFSDNGFRYYIETVNPDIRHPFIKNEVKSVMDMQLNIFASRI